MEIGDWPATRDLNDLYREIRSLGLEAQVAELEAFGFRSSRALCRLLSPNGFAPRS